ncbi:20459_t:CDS:2 [Dentiscutata erythropus]|uniref:20459_t:CDS:1 n=1 Tax=Dentiscutata erythropus TaxID=1348616 RepID=A0A9N9GBK8_9GLOM|nr:20459_t:CDS:2 [Dentiscutata erythropus]
MKQTIKFTIKGFIKYVNNRPVYYVKYGSNFKLKVVSNYSSSDTAMKAQEAINELNRELKESRILDSLLFAIKPELSCDYAVSNQHIALISTMASFISINIFNLFNQDDFLINERLQYVEKVAQ